MSVYIPLEIDEYKTRFKDANVDHVLIDVRTHEEYEEMRIPGAILMPLDELEDFEDAIPEGKPIIMVCRSGIRSIIGAEKLRYLGIEGEIYNLEGGTRGWAMKRYPLETGEVE